MNVVPIFADLTSLWAMCYGEGNDARDVLEETFENWRDAEWLEAFFTEYEEDLAYYSLTIEEAVLHTIELVELVTRNLLSCAAETNNQKLDDFFKPLSKREIPESFLQRNKHPNRWLRLYAIRIEPNVYVISGGAIKLTKTMQERKHTARELYNLRRTKAYLKSQGLTNEAAFYELL